jgi:hypothetical protein
MPPDTRDSPKNYAPALGMYVKASPMSVATRAERESRLNVGVGWSKTRLVVVYMLPSGPPAWAQGPEWSRALSLQAC